MLRVDLKGLRKAQSTMELQRQRQHRLILELQAQTAALLKSTEQTVQLEEQRLALHQSMDELEQLAGLHTQLLRCLSLAEQQYTWTAQRVERRCEQGAIPRSAAGQLTSVSLKRLRDQMQTVRFSKEGHHVNGSNRNTD